MEYTGHSPPARRRKSWSSDNWVGHEGHDSEWCDTSSWEGPSHERGYRHAKPMDEARQVSNDSEQSPLYAKKLLQDWSKDWKAWKDEGAWKRGSSSSSNRGFGGTFECESTTVKPRIFSQVGAGSAADAAPRKTVGSLALLHLILVVKGCIRLPRQLSVGLGCEALVRTVFMPVPEP